LKLWSALIDFIRYLQVTLDQIYMITIIVFSQKRRIANSTFPVKLDISCDEFQENKLFHSWVKCKYLQSYLCVVGYRKQ
jgi:hypothetical protein